VLDHWHLPKSPPEHRTDEKVRRDEERKKTDSEIDEQVYRIYGLTEDEKAIIFQNSFNEQASNKNIEDVEVEKTSYCVYDS